MPYTPTSWVSGTTPVDAPEMNNLETVYTESTLSYNPDLFAAFVLTGLVATKDGSVANKLDVTAGTAYLTQTDGTLRQRKPVASNQTTVTASTTYYLFLNNDGTFTWGTSSTPPTNSLAICQVTTDGSGNILVVTDVRVLNPTVFPSLTGYLTIPQGFLATLQSAGGGAAGKRIWVGTTDPGSSAGEGDVWIQA